MVAHPLAKVSATGASLAVLASRGFSSSSTPASFAAATTARAGQPCPALSGKDSTGAAILGSERIGLGARWPRSCRAPCAAPPSRQQKAARSPLAFRSCTASLLHRFECASAGSGAAFARFPFRGAFVRKIATSRLCQTVQASTSSPRKQRQHACMPPDFAAAACRLPPLTPPLGPHSAAAAPPAGGFGSFSQRQQSACCTQWRVRRSRSAASQRVTSW